MRLWVCVYVHVCIYACLSVCQSVCQPSVCLSIYLSLCLSVCLFVSQSVCLSVCLSGWLPICLSVCVSVCLSIAVTHWRHWFFMPCLILPWAVKAFLEEPSKHAIHPSPITLPSPREFLSFGSVLQPNCELLPPAGLPPKRQKTPATKRMRFHYL